MENGSPLSPDKPEVDLRTKPAAPAEPEAPPAREASAPIPTPGVSKALKGLMDREKAIREQAEGLKGRERSYQEAEALKGLAQDNPLDFLQRIGITREQLSQQLSEYENPDPQSEVREKLTKLEQQLAQRSEREEAERKEAALEEAQSIVKSFVSENADTYKLTSSANMHGLVYQRIYEHYETTGEALSEADAANEVEEYLSGIKAMWSQESNEPPARTSSTTLTNSLAAQTPTRTDKTDFGLLTEEESLVRAAAVLKYR